MKIFITGIAGFLGSNLAEHFIELGDDVYGCDNLHGGDIKNIESMKLKFFQGDCNDFNFMKSCIPNDTDCMVHCAAYAHEGLSVFSPHLISSNIFPVPVTYFFLFSKKKGQSLPISFAT